jgi:transcriptional regulator of NAD metabolism
MNDASPSELEVQHYIAAETNSKLLVDEEYRVPPNRRKVWSIQRWIVARQKQEFESARQKQELLRNCGQIEQISVNHDLEVYSLIRRESRRTRRP